MNGYVEAGYVVVLGTLSAYGAALVGRERAARRRVRAVSPFAPRDLTGTAEDGAPDGDASEATHPVADGPKRGAGP